MNREERRRFLVAQAQALWLWRGRYYVGGIVVGGLVIAACFRFALWPLVGPWLFGAGDRGAYRPPHRAAMTKELL